MMTKSFFKKMGDSVMSLPTPKSLSYFWSVGSLLGMLMVFQIMSGIFLSFYYVSGEMSWASVVGLVRETSFGWIIRLIHFNGASLVFFFIFIHLFRGMIQGSYYMMKVWISGWLILVLTMLSAFVGYVLPWGQMSLWGATAIINLLSVLPFGSSLVIWLWGGYYVSKFTCSFFFSIHFIAPLIVLLLILVHLIFLHENGSSAPSGLGASDLVKVKFGVLFSMKDLINLIVAFVFMMLATILPFYTSDPVNFSPSDLTSSPLHIQPEWYFLHYYAVLRSIPNKVGGVVMFGLSLVMLMWLSSSYSYMSMSTWKPYQYYMYMFGFINLMLMWLGSSPVEPPFFLTGQILTVLYFLFFMIMSLTDAVFYKMMK